MSLNALKLRSLRTRAKKVVESAAMEIIGGRTTQAEFLALARLFEELIGEIEAATLREQKQQGRSYSPANTLANKRARHER